MIELAGYTIPDAEIVFTAMRSQGAGGQNVNKVSTAVLLRWKFSESRLPETIKRRIARNEAARINSDGDLLIKAQRFRTQERNKNDALARLQAIVARHAAPQKRRIATRPTKASVKRRVDAKTRRGQLKNNRKPVDF